MKKEFYEKALPRHGTYCVTGIKDKRILNRFTDSLDGVMDLVEAFDKREFNVFVAPNTFNGASRKASNAAFAKSFFLDLDVGADRKKKYPTKRDAMIALGNFVEEQELPPPVVTDSGTGVHAYWLFDEEIPSTTWRIYAEKFKAFCMKHLLIDPAVPADRARILRCPETRNFKTTPPTPSAFITDNFYEYSFDAFKEFLGEEPEEEELSGMAAIFANVEKGLDEDTGGVARIDPNFESVFAVLAQRSLDNEGGCAQIDYMLRHAAELSEPMWRAGLSIARACVDWEEAIHIMSSPHPDYSPETTAEKAERTVGDKGPQPYKCSTIEEFGEEARCDTCPYKGKITSPIVLAKRLKLLEESEDEVEPSEDDDDGEIRYTTYPDEIQPYMRGPNGGVWYKPPAKKDKDGNWVPQTEIQILQYNLYPIKRMYGGQDGETIVFRYDMPHDGSRTFALSMMDINVNEYKQTVGRAGVVINNGMEQLVAGYLKKWATYMQSIKRADQTRMQMGWTDDYKGFVVGAQEYRADGTTVKTAASPMVSSIAKLMTPKGSLSEWTEAANKLNRPGYEMHAFALLCGFGSPLLHLTPMKGVVVGMVGATGAAKSGALYAGASLFGEPYDLTLSGAKKGSTENALVQWYMGHKNIMMGLDEASNYKPEEISDLFYRMTQGKNKLRLQSSVNAVREIELSASLISVLTSNQSMIDKIVQFKSNPDGELARYLELKISKPPTMNNIEGKEIFDTFRRNYGLAGPVYIQHLLARGGLYQAKMVDAWVQRFYKDVGTDTAYRFYESLISAAFGGGDIANEIKLIDFDLERIYRVVVAQIIANVESSVSNKDYEVVLGDFQNKNQGATLVLKDGRVAREPKSSNIVARVVEDEGMYYVSRSAIRTYLAELQISEKEFVMTMEAKKLLRFRGKQRLTAGWPGMAGAMSPVTVWGFYSPVPSEVLQNDGD
jgi:hypothetical protein